MDYNNKLYKELAILVDIIEAENEKLKFRLENDPNFQKSTEDLDTVSFGKLLYTLTKGLTPKELLDMSDSEMVKHIQKLQIKERE